jgi:choice-of-anchor A domain-containing protein
MALPPSLALAQSAADLSTLKRDIGTVTSLASGIIGVVNGATTILSWLGAIHQVTDDDVLAEVDRVATYGDQQDKRRDITASDSERTKAYEHILDFENFVQNNGDPTSDYAIGFLDEIEDHSLGAISLALAPDGQCTDLAIFNLLSNRTSGLVSFYDWRTGMTEAVRTIITRLAAMALETRYNPIYKPNPGASFTPNYLSEITAMWRCLQRHMNYIHPPKPFRYCYPAVSCGQAGCGCSAFKCQDFRGYVQWPTQTQTPAWYSYSLCNDLFEGTASNGEVPSYAAVSGYDEVDVEAESSIDHDSLPTFALQRMINSLKMITNGPPDLAATNHHIPFAASPDLCLSLSSAQNIVILEKCSSGSQNLNWSYDRSTGRIKNLNTGLCIGALEAPGDPSSAALGMVTCTVPDPSNPPASSDEMQTWNWSPDTGVIKNALGSVLRVSDTTSPVIYVWANLPEDAKWRPDQQIWTNGLSSPSSSSSCTGAICVQPVLDYWRQGPIGTTGQVYPRDFSVFTYLQANNLWDVAGPVATHGGGPYDHGEKRLSDPSDASSPAYELGSPYDVDYGGLGRLPVGGIWTGSFRINAQMPVGLVDGAGNLVLFNGGSLFGKAYVGPYGTVNIASTVTMGQLVKTSTDTDPINFEIAFSKLRKMSAALRNYTANGKVAMTYGNMTLSYTGNADPMVFSVKGTDLSNTFSITFNVPSGRTVLVNVSGTPVFIKYAGISCQNGCDATKMLWNLPDAVYLETHSLTVPGSILAPQATAQLNQGALNGTLAAWAVTAPSFEFHWYPFNNNAIVVGH